MKLSLNWIKQFTSVDMPVDELARKIGAQLGEVEGVEALGPKYDKAVVAKVVTCEDHPNADRLHVCMIDDGGKTPDVPRDEHGRVQVVCGAPNVTAGVTVVWLPPGATVPESYGKEPFVLEARELRGVLSNGMLASPKELGIGDSHEGILLLDADKQPGTSFAGAYELDDCIIEIENKMFTHRPDLFGELGLAREVAGINGQQFTSPKWYTNLPSESVIGPSSKPLTLEVRNELPELVPRFMAVALSDIEIKPSPVSLQTSLARVGIRPINNVVDITNYMMILTGQPLHAYDYDKVKALSGGDTAVIGARNPHAGEQLALLSGKTIEPRREAIIIATDQQAIGLGGVMGGGDTEVDDNTKNIILEVATFDMYSIRRTSMAHGLFTDAVTRFNKGQSPLQNPFVLAETVRLLGQLAGAKRASDVIDDNHIQGREWVHPPVPVSVDFINERLGLMLSADEMKTLLQNVEFRVEVSGDNLTVTAPFWRTDIETREDVVEEVGRLHGFDKLPLELPQRRILPVQRDAYLGTKSRIRDILSRAGANEVLTYSFVHGNLLEKVGQDPALSYKLSNALSPELQYYRQTILPSLLNLVHPNIKAGYEQFALFEMGKGHILPHPEDRGQGNDDVPPETERLALVFAAKDSDKNEGAAFYHAKRYLDLLLDELGLTAELAVEPYDPTMYVGSAKAKTTQYESARTARIGWEDATLGEIGEFRPAVTRALKLPKYSAGFELDLSLLVERAKPGKAYQELPRFPKVVQDLTLEVGKEVTFALVAEALQNAICDLKPEDTLAELTPLSIFQKEDDQAHVRMSFRMTIASFEKTMTDTEVTTLLEAVTERLHDAVGAVRI